MVKLTLNKPQRQQEGYYGDSARTFIVFNTLYLLAAVTISCQCHEIRSTLHIIIANEEHCLLLWTIRNRWKCKWFEFVRESEIRRPRIRECAVRVNA